jgi:chaperonin GroEL (HSP60 family)
MEETLGQIIKRVAEQNNLNARTLGEKINKTKQGTASIFKRDVIDSDLLLNLSNVLNYDFLAHLYKRQPLKRFKQKENAEWQGKIDIANEQINQLKELISLKDKTIKGLEKTIRNQEEVIKLLKEKEEFLSTRNNSK